MMGLSTTSGINEALFILVTSKPVSADITITPVPPAQYSSESLSHNLTNLDQNTENLHVPARTAMEKLLRQSRHSFQ